jgi:hypothetical protein
MTKLSFSISRALLLGALLILPIAASAQTPAPDEKQAAFEREWYDICYTKRDAAKCYELSKVYQAQYPNGTYKANFVKIIETKEINDLYAAYTAALQAFYEANPREVAKLEKLFSTGDAFLQRKPAFVGVTAQQALAGTELCVTDIYKDRAKVKGYVEKAITAFAGATTPEPNSVKQEDWQTFQDSITAAGYQFMGFEIKEAKGDGNAAIGHLTKSIQVKNPKIYGIGGWKDPNNYYFRSALLNDQYVALGAQYNVLPDDQKTGDAGKEVLKKINTSVDKLIAEYARLISVTTSPNFKSYQDFGKETFNALWKYRTDAPEKAAAYLQGYVADPTIADVEVPAKAVSDTAPAAGIPQATAGPLKVTGGGNKGAAGNGAKPAVNGKAKPAPKGKRKR